jgi:hypothetical protein
VNAAAPAPVAVRRLDKRRAPHGATPWCPDLGSPAPAHAEPKLKRGVTAQALTTAAQ